MQSQETSMRTQGISSSRLGIQSNEEMEAILGRSYSNPPRTIQKRQKPRRHFAFPESSLQVFELIFTNYSMSVPNFLFCSTTLFCVPANDVRWSIPLHFLR